MHASRGDHANCVRLLIDTGADIEAKSRVRRVNPLRLRFGCVCISI